MGYLYNMDVIINESQLRFLIEGRPAKTEDVLRDMLKNYKTITEFDKAHRGVLERIRSLGPCYDKTSGKKVNCLTRNPKTNGMVKTHNAHNTLGIYNNLTSHMEKFKNKWDDPKNIENEAKKYKRRDDFRVKSNGAYKASLKLGPCYDKTNGKIVKCMIFNPETRQMVNNPNAENSYEFLNTITSHMIGPTYGPKMVYLYTFFDGENNIVGVYVGMTNDEERRKDEHLTGKSKFTDKDVKSAVYNFKKENPDFKIEYTELSKMSDFDLAKNLEKKYVDEYKNKGYNILNIAKAGGGGRINIPDEYYLNNAKEWVSMKRSKNEIPYSNEYFETHKSHRRRLIPILKNLYGKEYKVLEDLGMVYGGLNTPDQTTPETTPSV